MRTNNTLVLLAVAGILSFTGCGSISNSEPLSGGYEEVTYTRNSLSEPSAHQITLQYRDSNGVRVMIWPSETGAVIHNDVAVFVAEKTSETPNPDNRRATTERLFAVRAPNLPLDITDQVLQQYCTETGLAFTNFVKDSFASLNKTDNALEIPFGILSRGERGPGTINIHGTTMTLSWHDIKAIMQDVSATGTIRKDRVWHTSYIEKDFKPEVQK